MFVCNPCKIVNMVLEIQFRSVVYKLFATICKDFEQNNHPGSGVQGKTSIEQFQKLIKRFKSIMFNFAFNTTNQCLQTLRLLMKNESHG